MGTVKVTVLDPGGGGTPAVGAKVVFINPDNTLVKQVATDTAGKAEAVVMIGASVTSIALISPTNYSLQTVIGVKPGDDLILGTKNRDFTQVGQMTFTYPAVFNAVQYEISTPCGYQSVPVPATGATGTAAVMFYSYCKQDTMEVVFVAVDKDGNALQSIHKTGVAYASGGTVALTTPEAARSFTSSYTNINPAVTGISLIRAVPDGAGVRNSASVAGPGTTAALSLVGGIASAARIETIAQNADGSNQRVRQTIGGSAATYGLDVGATLLPWLAPPSFDATTGKLVVPVDTTGTTMAAPDLFRISARFSRADAAGVFTSYSWLLFAPNAADLALPVLPAEVGVPMPNATDSVFATDSMIELDTMAGYDAVRHDLNATYELYVGERQPPATVRISLSPGRQLPTASASDVAR